MAEGLEEKIKGMQFSNDVTKIYVPDTNVLIDEPLAPLILSGNNLPNPELNSKLLELFRTHGKKRDNSPNDVIIYEVVEKELDRLKHDRRREAIHPEVSAATSSLLAIKKGGDFTFVDPSYSYSTLENGARVHFVRHGEKYFSELGIFDPSNDDRILWFIYECMKGCKDREFRFVTKDVLAQSSAMKLGIDAQKFEYDSVSDPNQVYSGIARIEMTDSVYQMIFGKSSVRTPRRVKNRVQDPKTNQFLGVEVKGEKRFHIFTHEGRYLSDLKNYEAFMQFMDNPDFSRIEGVVKHSGADAEPKTDGRSRIERLLSRYESSLKGSEIASYRSHMSGKKRKDPGFLAELEERLVTSLKQRGAYHEERISGILPPLTHFRPIDEQKAWVELCCNTDMPLRSVTGPAGTGKTFWALASGLYLFCRGEVDRIRYIKPLVGSDEGLGFMKGDFDEKVSRWVEPIIDDQLELFRCFDTTDLSQQKRIREFVDKLRDTRIVTYDVLTYMSGRTIRREFLILDETHFIKRKHIELMIGRVGRGTYLNFLGDPQQAGSAHRAYTDERNCGAVIVPDRLKGEKLFGHISLPEDLVQRSEAAKLASRFYR